MAVDVVPELNKTIQTTFQSRMARNRTVTKIANRIRDGTATLVDGHAYAEEVGKSMSYALRMTLVPENLPNGTVYYNIADRTIRPAITTNYSLVNDTAQQIQKVVDETSDIHLRSVYADFPEDRVDGLINKVVEDEADLFSRWLNEPIINLTESLFDDYIQTNAAFRARTGLESTISRIVAPGCCEWCASMGGRWEYGDEPRDVYRRHEYCRCAVVFDTGKYRQSVWSKKQWTATPEQLAERKTIQNPHIFAQNERQSVIEQAARDRTIERYMKATGYTRQTAAEATAGKTDAEIIKEINKILKRRERAARRR